MSGVKMPVSEGYLKTDCEVCEGTPLHQSQSAGCEHDEVKVHNTPTRN